MTKRLLAEPWSGLPGFTEGFFIFFGGNPLSDLTVSEERIAILGTGKVGTAVGYLLRSAGRSIVAVADKNSSALEKSLPYTGGKPCTHLSEAAAAANTIFITAPDDEIAGICAKLEEAAAISPGDRVIHMSGAGGLDLLEPARRAGALIASIHPIQSFADIEGAIKNLPGSTFGITAQPEIIDWSENLVRDLGGFSFLIAESDKPLYHAAACMASNYFTTLMHIVETIYSSLGLTHEDALKAFWPLVRGTMKNIERGGTVQALTGPIARGDTGTIRKHLAALNEKLPQFLKIYKTLGVLTVDLGLEKQTLDEERATVIKRLLEGETDHEYTK
ncbi:MAG: Rossmann-like domain protein [Syntrophus sp. PtaB.Bin075]|nr:MAG: Rossmann-like domain protein [Syntrophus sp. PtaB.Bin075]